MFYSIIKTKAKTIINIISIVKVIRMYLTFFNHWITVYGSKNMFSFYLVITLFSIFVWKISVRFVLIFIRLFFITFVVQRWKMLIQNNCTAFYGRQQTVIYSETFYSEVLCILKMSIILLFIRKTDVWFTIFESRTNSRVIQSDVIFNVIYLIFAYRHYLTSVTDKPSWSTVRF